MVRLTTPFFDCDTGNGTEGRGNVDLWSIDDLRVFVRDRDLKIVDEIPWLDIDVTLSTRRVNTWAIRCNGLNRVLSQMEKGGGVLITLGEYTLIEGFIDIIGPRSFDYEQGTNYVSYAGREDLCIIGDEIAWPEPTVATGGIQLSEKKWTAEGPAETVVLNLINANVGTTRHANRTILDEPTDPWLVEVPASGGRGDTTTIGARYEPLMDLIRTAWETTNLDLRVVPNSGRTGLEVEVFEYRDMTNVLSFNPQAQNLRTADWQESIPTFNSLIASLESHDTQTDGNDPETIRRRRIRGRHFQTHSKVPNTQAEWRRRIATHMDGGDYREDPETGTGAEASTIAAVDAWALSQFIQATRETWFKAVLISTTRTQLFKDFELGDLVKIVPAPGVEFNERITQITINASSDSGRLTITPVVGIPGEDPSDSLSDAVQKEIFARVRSITGI
jgi:hypothetical protein